MDDIQSILNAMMRAAVSPADGRGRDRGHRPQHPLRLHRPAQHRPVRLHAARRLRLRDLRSPRAGPWSSRSSSGWLVAFVFALVLGVPTLKLRGDYLAIVTISAAEIVSYVGRSVGVEWLFNLTGGAQGIPGSQYRGSVHRPVALRQRQHQAPGVQLHRRRRRLDPGAADRLADRDRADLVPWSGSAAARWASRARARGAAHRRCAGPHRPPGLLPGPGRAAEHRCRRLVVHLRRLGPRRVSLLIVLGLTKSPWGRALRGVREDEDAMRSLGKNVFAIKMQALVIGGLFGALGGMMYVLPATVQPDSLGRSITFFCYTALLLGGAATIWGPVLGSLIFFVGRVFIIAASPDLPVLRQVPQRHERPADQPVRLHRGRRRADAAGDLQTTRHPG